MEEDNSLNVQLFDGHIETWRLVLTSFFCWVITSLSVAAGIGGGGLLVPLYSIILGLGPKLAVPVSKATIFGVALGNAPIILRQRHPTADRPLVDYTIVTLMQSGVLLGVVLGVLLNLLLPEIAIVVLLALVLGFTGYKTVNKGRKQWATETKARAKVDPTVTAGQTVEAAGEESCAGSSGEAGGTTPSSPPPSPPERDVKHVSAYEMSGSNGHPPHAQTQVAATAPAVSTDEVEVEAREVSGKGRVDGKGASRGKLLGQAGGEIEGARAPLSPALSHTAAAPGSLERELADDSRAFPPWAWGSLLAMCAFLLAYSLLVNGFIDESINPCSPAYWPIYWLPVPFYVALLAFFARRASSSYERRLALSFPFAAGDIKWTAKTARRLPPVAVCSGAMSGMLGIGGGMLLGPLFISLELQPQVTTATTGLMLLFTGFAGTTEYLAVGKLPWQYLLWFGSLGAIGGQTGQRVVRKLIKKTGRPSIVVLLLGSIISVAVVCMTSIGVYNVISDVSAGRSIGEIDTDEFVCHAPPSALPAQALAPPGLPPSAP